ncbi:hypothetical protein DPEC_G00298050 [Dallia pectoralis]|uniref:Uncharacterized protein n=1 Tax=Dallia pectoralis TaxID=75939 RepID=A0ACC2FFR1_DALPE|nr:hypothetical protein DPEC_G00298050 [Dallia pectoralis]
MCDQSLTECEKLVPKCQDFHVFPAPVVPWLTLSHDNSTGDSQTIVKKGDHCTQLLLRYGVGLRSTSTKAQTPPPTHQPHQRYKTQSLAPGSPVS